MEDGLFSPATFRDPAGSLTIKPDGAYRFITPQFASDVLQFLETAHYRNLVSKKRMVASVVLPLPDKDQRLLLRHPLVAFRSYPWEWPPSLWLSAAELTLDICIELLSEGWILKDATPLNVLFQGVQPIFVDLPSVQRTDPSCALWYAYGQFVRTFLLPILAHSQLGWPLQAAIIRRDGYDSEELYDILSWSQRIRRPTFKSVTLPVLFANRTALGGGSISKMPARLAGDPELVEEVLRKALTSLKRDMQRAMPRQRQSQWSNYVGTAVHYNEKDHADKLEFVERVLAHVRPARVLDVGCNTGVYSSLAAHLGAEVVAIDPDSAAVERVAVDARKNGKDVLPLCVDLAHPTPATGWENQETASFLDRCQGHFDAVLMLAVIHHVLLGSQIPLSHIASLCSRLTTKDLIIEWIPPSDPKFVEVLRGREGIYRHIDERAFRQEFGQFFRTVEEKTLRNGRILLHLKKK